MNAPINNTWSVYDVNGKRVTMYSDNDDFSDGRGKTAQGKARRHAARLGNGFSHCIDRGENRWEDIQEEKERQVKCPECGHVQFQNLNEWYVCHNSKNHLMAEMEAEEKAEMDDWSEDEDTEVEEIESDESNCSDEVYEQRKQNIKQENELLSQFGIVPSGHYVSRGTASAENVRLRNENFGKLPHITDASMLDIANVIDDERRTDHLIAVSSLWMKPSGILMSNDIEIGPIEDRAFKQLLSRIGVFPSVHQAFKLWPINIVADTINDVIEHYKDNTNQFWDDKKNDVRKISIGTRKNTALNGNRSVFRAVSTSYQGGMNCADMLKATQRALKDHDGRVDISYNPETTKVQADVLWQKEYKTEPSLINPMCEGSVFQFGLRITSADAANHRFLIQPIARRDNCNNCQMISTEKGFLVQKRHIGDLDAIKAAMFGDEKEDGAVSQSMELIAPMLEQWGYLEGTAVTDVRLWGMKFKETEDASASENAIKWAIKNDKIGKGIAKKVLLDVILSNFEKEPSPCLDGIVNAVTRAAHESLFNDIQRSLLEEQAGELIRVLA